MRKIAICIIIAAAVFWAAQDGRNAPPRPVAPTELPNASSTTHIEPSAAWTVTGGGAGTVYMPGSGSGSSGVLILETIDTRMGGVP